MLKKKNRGFLVLNNHHDACSCFHVEIPSPEFSFSSFPNAFDSAVKSPFQLYQDKYSSFTLAIQKGIVILFPIFDSLYFIRKQNFSLFSLLSVYIIVPNLKCSVSNTTDYYSSVYRKDPWIFNGMGKNSKMIYTENKFSNTYFLGIFVFHKSFFLVSTVSSFPEQEIKPGIF